MSLLGGVCNATRLAANADGLCCLLPSAYLLKAHGFCKRKACKCLKWPEAGKTHKFPKRTSKRQRRCSSYLPPRTIPNIVTLIARFLGNMSEQTMDGKRALDHDPDTESSDAKRSRVIYVVESPGGTLREASPSKVRRTCAEPISVDSNPPHQAVNSSIAVRSQLRDELSLLSIEEKLRKGIAMSLERERTYERAIIKGIERNPRLKFKDVQDLEGSLLTITGMQKVADLASHLDLPIHPGFLTAAGATKNDDVNEVTVDESMEIYPGRFYGVSMRKAVMGLTFQQKHM